MSLLKMALARNDEKFTLRISAAALVHAREITDWELQPQSRAFCDYVLANPLLPIPDLVTEVSVNPVVQSNIQLANTTPDSSLVPDEDIQYSVNTRWDAVAAKMFPGT